MAEPTIATRPTGPPSAPSEGLTTAEVAERRTAGHGNRTPDRTSRTYGEIVRANVLTRFNAILLALAIVVLVVGDPIDALFSFVMVFNTGIGILQEIRAKRTLDRLRVLVAPTIGVVRDGTLARIPPAQLVIDDVIQLEPGDQVPVDGQVVTSAGLEVDESALTGEIDPVPKASGDDVRSGSAVLAGTATIVATAVGTDTWIHQLVSQAKEFALTKSELRTGVDRILQVVGWLLPPLAVLLVWSQLRGDSSVADGLVAAVAGVVGLVPQGLVLLVSLSLALAVLRLARNHVVVQELAAAEGLARIDVLCVDKTGTLTTGKLTVESIEPLEGSAEQLTEGLAAFAATEPTPTAALQVVAAAVPPAPPWEVEGQVAFSSARKWSATAFAGHGTWVLGAPEILLDAADPGSATAARRRVGELAQAAKRVLLVARSDEALSGDESLPPGLRPVGLVVLAEEIRADAAATMAYFAEQHVTVKVISGDNPETVSAVARGLGLVGAEQFLDLRTVTGPLADVVEATTVFGRVLPEQKRELVEALQAAGHVVAMTGDGVNDIPALKKADIGIAMDTATSATKAVAQLILLDGRFDRLPQVVAEGRRVVTNMERVSSLFVTKTVYAAVFALAIGISGAAFPFLPRHMSLISELTIGVPAFALSFRGTDAVCRSGYLRRVVQFALPAGLVAATVTLATYWLTRSPLIGASLAEARTASTFALVAVGFWILSRLMRPIDRYDIVLLGGLITVFGVILATPALADFYAFDWPAVDGVVATAALTGASIAVMAALLTVRDRRS